MPIFSYGGNDSTGSQISYIVDAAKGTLNYSPLIHRMGQCIHAKSFGVLNLVYLGIYSRLNAGTKTARSKQTNTREQNNILYLHEGCVSTPVKFSFNFLNFDSSRSTGSTFPLFLCKQLYKSSAVNVKNSMFLTSFCGWGFVKQFVLDGLSIVEACILDKIDHYR